MGLPTSPQRSPNLPVKKIPVHIKSAQNRVLIKGGKIVNHDQSYIADVYVEDGLIKDIGENLIVPGGTKTIEAKGKLVIPGGIDTSTNFELYFMNVRSADDFYTGTKAALAGGTTTVMNFILENKNVSLLEAYNANKAKAEKKSCCDYAFHPCVVNFDEKVAKDMEVLAKEKGVNSFKVFMAYKNNLMMKDEDLIKVFKKCKELGCIPMVHAENGDLVEECQKKVLAQGITGPEGHLLSHPESGEVEATQRAITLADQINCPVFITHLMSKSAAHVVSEARRHGSVVVGEPIAASLGTDGSHYYNKCWRHAAGHVASPPLRDDPTTPQCLMDLLSCGDLEVTGSDHCVFNTNQKALGKDDFTRIPSGLNGVEDRMTIIWDKGVRTGKIDACKFVAITSTNAAKLFNMYPRKGCIAKGSDADIVIWDPESSRTISAASHHQAVDFNIFENMTCYGVPSVVITNGRIALEDGTLNVVSGSGRLVETPCFPDVLYKRVTVRDGLKLKKIEREPYTGPVVDITKEIEQGMSDIKVSPIVAANNMFHQRPLTKSGGRNCQDSSFTLSGEHWDDQIKTGSRVKQPPGGKSQVQF